VTVPNPSPDFITLAGVKYRIKPPDTSRGERTFIEHHRDRHIPRQDVDGRIGEQNLDRSQWAWTASDWSGGEGARVFNSQGQGEPPHFWKTDGGIDTRISGEFKMSPVTTASAGSGGTSTTIEGSALATDAGSPTVTGSNIELNALNESVRTGDRTPAASGVSVTFRLVDIHATADGLDVITARFRVRNETTATNSDVTRQFDNVESGSHTETISFTANGTDVYRYYVTVTAFTNTGSNPSFEVDKIVEDVGTNLTDVRALALGYEEKVYAYHWDGTNTDIFVWDQANSDWDSVDPDVDNSLPVAATNSDSFQYLLVADRVIFRHTDAAAASTTYTTQKANTVAGGIAVAGARLYQLLFGSARELGELTLDGAGTYTSGDANWKVVMTTTDFPDEESHDTTLRQQITSIGNGVRFIVNSRGGVSQVYEFAEGAGRPLRNCVLGGGYTMTAIHHNAGITWIGAVYSGSGTAPAKDRASLWYIGADEVLRLAVEFRPDDPDENRIAYIASDQHYVYAQHGNHLWQYDPTRGGHVMDTHCGSSGELGRGLAVLDTKKFAAFSGEGVQVSQNSYPIDQTVYLYSPAWDFDTQSEKVLLSFDVLTAPLPAATTVKVEYETDYSGTWAQAGSTISTDNSTFTTLTVSTSSATTSFRVLRYRVGLASTDGASTPTIRAVTAWARISPDDHDHRFEMTLLLDDDTSGSHLPGQQMRGYQKADLLRTAHATGNLLAFVDHYDSDRPGDTTTYTAIVAGAEISREGKSDPNQRRYGEAQVELEVID
jgi:hypothetical protein